jgi:YebC/PmpR family DNA-binding regulatory protein
VSGHSKWANIKHQKGAEDAKRGQLFTRLTREIMIAVKEGGDNPDSNFRLRLAMLKAKDGSMPLDNVQRAIKRASGKEEGVIMTEVRYEGHGPGGVAILVETVSDNRNRTLQELRNVFSRGGGSLSESGSVSWMFQQKGVINVSVGNKNADDLSLQAIDAGADDVNVDGDTLIIYTKPQDVEKVRLALEEKGVTIGSVEVSFEPKPENTVTVEDKKAVQTVKLLDKLENMDDVQKVYSNVSISEEVMKQVAASLD